jgi:pimeloyl-ACP methyl ester carboxylesterase
LARVRVLLALLLAFVAVPTAFAQPTGTQVRPSTRAMRIRYRAHDGRLRPAWLLLPVNYDGRPIPLVISPHGRGIGARLNARLWGDLPGDGGFAVINPAGEGRRLHYYSWGARGQINDLARMPQIVEAAGVHVDRQRIYAVGGSMGGQETLLLLAEHPRLLAGAVAFDPATDMRRRYLDFASLKNGRTLRSLARREIGGTPAQVPLAYARRSPDHYIEQIANAGVPLQLYWSARDRVIVDQRVETRALAIGVRRDDPGARLWDFSGDWEHTAEMHANRRLPRALARFGLLPWNDVPALPTQVVRRAPVTVV